jgi:uncharacterized glyoxalase superfamily protein PhnB
LVPTAQLEAVPANSETDTLISLRDKRGQVAQLVEQRTENPRVGGSIPSLATISQSPQLTLRHSQSGGFVIHSRRTSAVCLLHTLPAASQSCGWRQREHSSSGGAMSAVSVQSIAPILIVSEIEPCLEFWTRIGFQKIAEVPHGDRLGFVMFTSNGQNLMLQTEASADADVPNLAPRQSGGVVYLNVQSIDAVEQTIDKNSVVMPRRETFYGASEIWVREPGGNLVGFAQHK